MRSLYSAAQGTTNNKVQPVPGRTSGAYITAYLITAES
jgi:hypothetical protein